MCAPVSETRPDSPEGEFLMIQTYLPGNTRSPYFFRDSFFHRNRVCVPLSFRQDLSHHKVNFLMIQTYLPGNSVGLGLLRVRQTRINKIAPSNVEMLNAITGLLHPQVECLVAPVFSLKPSEHVVRKQNFALSLGQDMGSQI